MYCPLADAETYFSTYILNNTTWDDATDADKTKALKMATKLIDNLDYYGSKTDSDQDNEFPRNDDTEVPQDIKDACVDIALRLIDGVDTELEHENLAMTSQGYGNVRSSYDRSIPNTHLRNGIPSIEAWRKLLKYLKDPEDVNIHRIS